MGTWAQTEGIAVHLSRSDGFHGGGQPFRSEKRKRYLTVVRESSIIVMRALPITGALETIDRGTTRVFLGGRGSAPRRRQWRVRSKK